MLGLPPQKVKEQKIVVKSEEGKQMENRGREDGSNVNGKTQQKSGKAAPMERKKCNNKTEDKPVESTKMVTATTATSEHEHYENPAEAFLKNGYIKLKLFRFFQIFQWHRNVLQ